MRGQRHRSNLAERTTSFSKNVIDLAKSIRQNAITRPIISQRVRASTSIGANYHEADGAESDKDLIHRFSICRNEANESSYWLRLVIHTAPYCEKKASPLEDESRQLHLIFCSMVHNLRRKNTE